MWLDVCVVARGMPTPYTIRVDTYPPRGTYLATRFWMRVLHFLEACGPGGEGRFATWRVLSEAVTGQLLRGRSGSFGLIVWTLIPGLGFLFRGMTSWLK